MWSVKNLSALIRGKFVFSKRSFTRFALQSKCCNFNQWELTIYNRSHNLAYRQQPPLIDNIFTERLGLELHKWSLCPTWPFFLMSLETFINEINWLRIQEKYDRCRKGGPCQDTHFEIRRMNIVIYLR